MKKMNKRLDRAAWSAARFSETYEQLKKLKEGDPQEEPALRIIRRETCILLRRLFWLWLTGA